MAVPPRYHEIQYSVRSYTVGWFAPLACERAAAEALRDEVHGPPKDFQRAEDDHLDYSWGRMGDHNFVLASLEAGTDGLVATAKTATRMLASFPGIRFSLLVGIGGAIPRFNREGDVYLLRPDPDVRLGDVVVSQPDGNGGGVIQYDHYKATKDGPQVKGSLNRPPPALLYGLSALQAEHNQNPSIVPNIIASLEETNKYMANERGYKHPGQRKDRLFDPSYSHPEGYLNCKTCSEQHEVKREPRKSPDPKVHYGTIASGNVVVKNAEDRETLIKHHPSASKCLCYEMEAAGLMNNFPCLVIRGICDYSDSHKNDVWHNYAALVAAAFAKELLLNMARDLVEEAIIAKDLMQDRENMMNKIERILKPTNTYSKSAEIQSTLQSVNLDIKEAGQWFLDSSKFQHWRNSCGSFLWVYGLPGSGKTVLSASVISSLQSNPALGCVSRVVLHYYFDFQELKNGQNLRPLGCMLRSFLLQLSRMHDCMLEDLYEHLKTSRGDLCESQLEELLFQMTRLNCDVKIVIDALDEMEERQRETVCDWITKTLKLHPDRFSFLVTSRRERDIEEQLHLKCESLEMSANRDIEKYVFARIKQYKLNKVKRWSEESLRKIMNALLRRANGMFQWVVCQLDQLLDHPQTESFGDDEIDEVLRTLPQNLTDTYDQILERIPNGKRDAAYRLLQFLLFCKRPIRVLEANDFLAVDCTEFKISKRLKDPREVTCYCSSLVTLREPFSIDNFIIDNFTRRQLRPENRVTRQTEIVLAHASVRDYLLFNRAPGKEQINIFGQIEANKAIFKTCSRYIHFFSTPDADHPYHQDLDNKFPLAPYAMDYLFAHASVARTDEETINLVTAFFRSGDAFRTLVCHKSTKRAWHFCQDGVNDASMESVMRSSTLYTAAHYGLKNSLRMCLGRESYSIYKITSEYAPLGFWKIGDESSTAPLQTFQCISLLYAAAMAGHEDTVRMLIKAGTTIDEVGGPRGTALDAACASGSVGTVEALLENAKQRSTSTMWFEGALRQVVKTDSLQLVHVFLKHGFLTESAIFDAALYGNTTLVQELMSCRRDLRHLADLKLPLSSTNTPSFLDRLSAWIPDVFSRSSRSSHEHSAAQPLESHGVAWDQWSEYDYFVQLLKGSLNLPHLSGTALQAAAFGDHDEIVEALLKEDWDPNATGGYFGTALQAAAAGGSPRVVQRLLDAGAEPNTTGGFFKTALNVSLMTASWTRANWLDVDWSWGSYTGRGSNRLRGLVCERFRDRYGDSANYETVVAALLKAGAQPLRGGLELHYALELETQEAALNIIENVVSGAGQAEGDFHTVATLLRGKDIAPLPEAISRGWTRVVESMIRNGAAIDVLDSFGWTPLHHAMWQYNQDIALMVIHAVAQRPDAANLFKAKNSSGITAVHYAAQLPVSSKTMKHLLCAVEQAGVLIEFLDARCDRGRTALHYAMRQNNQDIALMVIQAVSQQPDAVSLLKAKDSKDMTAVHYAAQLPVSSETMKHLLGAAEQAGILIECLDARSNCGQTVLHYAMQQDNQDVTFVVIQTVAQQPNAASLLKVKDNSGMTAVHYAAEGPVSLETMKYLLGTIKQAGILTECLDARSNCGRTALHYAPHYSPENTSSMVQLLIETAASAGILAGYVDVRDDRDETALHCAASCYDARGVTFLLRASADGEVMNLDKQNFVDCAREGGGRVGRLFDVCPEAIGPFCSSMEEARAITSAVLLHQFVDLNDVAAVKKVTEKTTFHRSFLDIPDADYGMTLLHRAAEKGYTALAELLLDFGAQPEGLDKKRMTPLHRAAKGGCLDMVTALLQKIGNEKKEHRPYFSVADFRKDDSNGFLTGTPSDRQDSWGNTPLHYAVQNESVEMVKCLIHCGATMRMRNKEGNTSFDIVQKKRKVFPAAAKICMPRDTKAANLIAKLLVEEYEKYDDGS